MKSIFSLLSNFWDEGFTSALVLEKKRRPRMIRRF